MRRAKLYAILDAKPGDANPGTPNWRSACWIEITDAVHTRPRVLASHAQKIATSALGAAALAIGWPGVVAIGA